MDIKRTVEIFQEQFNLSKPETSGEFTKHLVKKWIPIQDVIDELTSWELPAGMQVDDFIEYLENKKTEVD